MNIRSDGAPRSYAIVAGDFVRTGGMDVANYALADFLARQKRAIDLVAYRVAADLQSHANVKTHRVPKPAGAYAMASPLLAAVGLVVAGRTARRGGCVVVNGGNCGYPATNWVHYVHAAYEPRPARRDWRALKARVMHRAHLSAERYALRVASLVVANSNRTRRDVIERVGVPEDRARTVYYGTDAQLLRIPSDAERLEARQQLAWNDERPRVVFIGALGDRRKGFDVVYDAWRSLCARPSWDARLVVVGTGAELPAWRARTESDGLNESVAFLGFRNDVPRVLAASDALVAPTRYEAYGLGVHEALCCGLPAVVSSNAGVAERYPPALSSLLLEDPESAAAVATTLTRWRERAAEWRPAVRELSDALRSRSWDDMARDIVSLCEMH